MKKRQPLQRVKTKSKEKGSGEKVNQRKIPFSSPKFDCVKVKAELTRVSETEKQSKSFATFSVAVQVISFFA